MSTTMSATETPNTIPAYLSADGGDAVHVCTIDGCEVWAVRRLHGYSAPQGAAYQPQSGDAYWTTVVQTAAGREKSMAFAARRSYEYGGTGRDAARDMAVYAAVASITIVPYRSDDPGDCIVEEYRGRVVWGDAGRVVYDKIVARARADRAEHLEQLRADAARAGRREEGDQWERSSSVWGPYTRAGAESEARHACAARGLSVDEEEAFVRAALGLAAH